MLGRHRYMKTSSKKMFRTSFLFGAIAIALTLLLVACGTPGSAGATGTAAPSPTPTTQTTTGSGSGSSGGSQPSHKPTVPLTAIRMLDRSHGWALTQSSILKTSDGGAHWQDITPDDASLNMFTKGDFVSDQYAWIATPQANANKVVVLYTSNGGASWGSSTINDPGPTALDMPHFLNTSDGWLEVIDNGGPGAGQESASIFQSTNGGQTWTKIATTDDPHSGLTREGFKSGISFRDLLNGWATTSSDTGRPLNPGLYVTHNGGHTWQSQPLPLPQGLGTIVAIGTTPPVFFGQTALMPVNVGYGTQTIQQATILYVSHDGGASWQPTAPLKVATDNVYVIDPQHAWATDVQTGQFYTTSNGGQSWQSITGATGKISALSFVDDTHGWAATTGTTLLVTTDGTHWTTLQYTIQ